MEGGCFIWEFSGDVLISVSWVILVSGSECHETAEHLLFCFRDARGKSHPVELLVGVDELFGRVGVGLYIEEQLLKTRAVRTLAGLDELRETRLRKRSLGLKDADGHAENPSGDSRRLAADRSQDKSISLLSREAPNVVDVRLLYADFLHHQAPCGWLLDNSFTLLSHARFKRNG